VGHHSPILLRKKERGIFLICPLNSVRAEPFDLPFVLRLSKGERFAQDRLVEA
jgi:hypothetical protein